jgi:hypothetical protein
MLRGLYSLVNNILLLSSYVLIIAKGSKVNEISGFHCHGHEDGCLLGCCTALMKKAVSSSEISLNIYYTTR